MRVKIESSIEGELLKTYMESSHFVLWNQSHVSLLCEHRVCWGRAQPDLNGQPEEGRPAVRRVLLLYISHQTAWNWFMGWLAVLWRFYWDTATPIDLYICCLAAFELQQQSLVVVTECGLQSQNIYCLTLYRKSLLTFSLYFIHYIIWICCKQVLPL